MPYNFVADSFIKETL